jgi:hypothetical protein
MLTQTMAVRMKQGTTVLLYKKLHSVNMSSLNKVSTGKIVNVVTAELTGLATGMTTVPLSYSIPLVVVFTLGYLWTLFGYFCLAFVVAFVSVSCVIKKCA